MSAGTHSQRLREAILARRDSLTPTERLIANHLLEHPWNTALMSIRELAARWKTAPASIIRISRKLGFRSFSELKRGLKLEMRESPSPLNRFKLALEQRQDREFSGLASIAEQEIANLQATLQLLQGESLAKAVALLRRAKLVFSAGAGISHHLAGLAAFVFQHIGVRAFALPLAGSPLSEQLLTIQKGEVLLCFAFPPYSAQTIEAAALARKQGASVIGITNQTLSPLAKHCHVLLVAKTESKLPSNSLTAPLLVVYGLAGAVAASQRKQSLKAIEQTISLRHRNRHRAPH